MRIFLWLGLAMCFLPVYAQTLAPVAPRCSAQDQYFNRCNGNTTPEPSGWQQIAEKIQALRAMHKDEFETTAEFGQRQQAAAQALQQELKQAAEKRNPAYQAGTASKTQYDADSTTVTLALTWHAKALEIFPGLKTITSATANIAPAEAKAGFGQPKPQPLFITATWQESTLSVSQVVLGMNDKIYPVLLLPMSVSSAAGKGITVSGRTYIAYDNGTALDTQTNLLWMRCSLGQTWDGKTCTGKAKTFDWNDAIKQTANFAGHSDWRIPKIEELRTLVYCSSGKPEYFRTGENDLSDCDGDYERPTIVQAVFPNTPSSFVWSGSPANLSSNAWYVHFSYGYGNYRNRHGNSHVRLVRGGQ